MTQLLGDEMERDEKSPAELTSARGVGDDIFGYMAGKAKIVGDVVGPITPLDDWECGPAAAR
ncbi:MAG TPA: hypothetical protein VH350_03780 [Candidatus Sulfotelmatobacter sp.]|nr:hypothetical protein [Candidatus Sulfotelmatobacter sp.]